jgi:hypothetical protein
MTTTTVPAAGAVAPVLRRLYLVRFGFALVWAVVLVATASSIGPVTAALLVIYPVFDVAAAVSTPGPPGRPGRDRASP